MMTKSTFDKNDRNTIEALGLNCIFIDEDNKDNFLKDLDYIVQNAIGQNPSVLNSKLLNKDMLDSVGIDVCPMPILIIDPRYFDEIFLDIVQKHNVQSLILDGTLAAFLKQPSVKAKALRTIDFIKKMPSLKLFYLQPQKDMIFSEFWDIDDFSSIEGHKTLEYLYIPNNTQFIDIDFSTLPSLKAINLQYPKENKTIYECKNIEYVKSIYYEQNLSFIKNWSKLKKLGAYYDKLESFGGIENFKHLKELVGQFTSAFKTFKGTNSKSIKTFMLYTEARNTPKTLEGIGGLEVAELIALNGLKKLEDLGDLYKCQNLKELRLERCHIPNNIGDTVKRLPKLERLILDDCGDIESIAFVKEMLSLKYLSVSENSKIIDGNLDFLKALAQKGVEIHFTPRKHYTITYDDVVIE
jgi:hypothetical protein